MSEIEKKAGRPNETTAEIDAKYVQVGELVEKEQISLKGACAKLGLSYNAFMSWRMRRKKERGNIPLPKPSRKLYIKREPTLVSIPIPERRSDPVKILIGDATEINSILDRLAKSGIG